MARAVSARERNLLVVLLGMALIYGFYRMRGGPESAGAARSVGAETEKAAKLLGAPVVNMAALDRPVDPIENGGRDIFKYTQRPPSPEEVRRMREEAARQAKAAELARKQEEERQRLLAEQQAREAEERAKLPPQPPPPPRPPAIAFRFIGYIGPKDERVAAFMEGQNSIFVAKVGDIVQEQFKIMAIRYDSVVIGYTKPEFKGQSQELPLARN